MGAKKECGSDQHQNYVLFEEYPEKLIEKKKRILNASHGRANNIRNLTSAREGPSPLARSTRLVIILTHISLSSISWS
jgi:hypothetical protein